MGFFTRPDLDDRQFRQESGSTLTLSGETNVIGVLKSKNIEIDASTGGTSVGDVFTWNGSKIVLEPSSGGGGGGDLYTGATPSNLTVGGIPSGTVLTGRTYTELFQQLLITTLNPNINPPSSTLVEDVANLYEVGTTIPTINFTATFNQGTIVPQYDNTGTQIAPSAPRSGPPTAYNYTGSQIVGTYPSSLYSDVRTATNYKITLGSNTWTGTVTYSGSSIVAYDSAGGVYAPALPAGTTTPAKSVTLTGQYLRFWGPNATTPASSVEVRALPSAYQTSNVNVFILNTGTALTKFVVVLPPGRTISSVIDLTNLNLNITSQYVYQGTISVTDGGGSGDPQTYNLYEMNQGSPYLANAEHQITTA